MKVRRIWAMCLAVIMLLGMANAGSADTPFATEHTHVWDYSNPEIHYPPTCTQDGMQQIFCSICGESFRMPIPALGHTWSDWIIVEQPTCVGSGLREHTCVVCGEVERESVSALGHNWGSAKTIKEATCYQTGTRRLTCSRCGKTTEETIPTTAHTWGSWYVVTAATDWSAGVEERKCAVCGATQQREFYPPGTLKEGDRGDEVKALQEALNAAGYDCGTADGIYGKKTASAVSGFAEENGHKGDGIAWPGLQELLAGAAPSDWNASITVGFVSYEATVPEEIGTAVELEIWVENSGESALSVGGFEYMDGSGNYPESDVFELVVKGNGGTVDLMNFKPHEGFQINYTTFVTNRDINAGAVYRTVKVHAAPADSTAVPVDGADSITVDFADEIPIHPGLTVTAGSTEGQFAVPGGEVSVDITLTNTGDTLLNTGYYEVTDPDGNSMKGVSSSDYRNGSTAEDELELDSDKSIYTTYTTQVTEDDVKRGSVIRDYCEYGYLITGEDIDGHEVTFPYYEAGPVYSNTIRLEWPIGESEAPETGEYHVTLGYGEYPASAQGDMWIDVPLTLANDGEGNVEILGSCVSAGESWGYDSPEVKAPFGGTGDPKNLRSGEYTESRLSFYVTPEDAVKGSVTRKVYFTYKAAQGGDGMDADVFKTNVIEITISVEKPQPGEGEVDLYLEANTPEGLTGSLGERLEIPLTAVNKGTAFADVGFYKTTDADGNAISDHDGLKFHDARYAPGLPVDITYYLDVTADDVARGSIVRTVSVGGYKMVIGPQGYLIRDYDENGDATDCLSNPVTIEIPLTGNGEITDDYPNLVLSVNQTSPVYEKYLDGELVSFNWTLTNLGGADIDYGYLYLDITNKERNAGYNLHPDEPAARTVLSAYGGHVGGTFSFQLDKNDLAEGEDRLYLHFGAVGYYPDTQERWMDSNEVAFDYLIDDYEWHPEEIPPTVEKWEESESLHDKGYAEGETVVYGVRVTNNNESGIADIEISDPLYDDGNGGHVILSRHDYMEKDEAVVLYFTYVVKPEDVERGWIDNTVTVRYMDLSVDDFRTADSNTVRVNTWKPPVPVPTTPEIFVLKIEKSKPEHGGFYVEGEVIEYEIIVVNDSDMELFNVNVSDSLADSEGGVIGYIPSLKPHSTSQAISFQHKVTYSDCQAGIVVNTAYADAQNGNGIAYHRASEPVTSYTGFIVIPPVTPPVNPPVTPPVDPPVKTPEDGLTVTKKETSKPANGKYYQLSEVITYEIIVKNTGDITLTDVIVMDTLQPVDHQEIASCEHLYPTESRTYSYSHTVTQKDVDNHWVINYAVGQYDYNGTKLVWSDPVRSPTSDNPEPPEKKISLPIPSEGEGPCTLTLNAKGGGTGEWTKHTCAVHAKTAQQVDQLIATAYTQDALTASWRLARAMWQQDLDIIYQSLYDAAAPGEAQLDVLNERIMFYAQLSAYEAELEAAYPDEPETVAMMTAEAMMLKCTEMCYEAHTAPSVRLDSYTRDVAQLNSADPDAECARVIVEHDDRDTRYAETFSHDHARTDTAILDMVVEAKKLTEAERKAALIRAFDKGGSMWLSDLNKVTTARYNQASVADRKAVTASRNTFTAWLERREILLEMFYPDSEEIRNEVIMAAIRDRTVSLCALPVDKNVR